ncbi:22302_t:CDS:2 [Dentiscutata erythropus]|uniref:22302_t:CDS:1 n=1 Tax=Dentiscutata erythropus TaxID=1348616 RepID=A0A9N9HYL7_9GLOM|nr:22302_t:CDS:2 [Dentiscutata erythropus]
MSSQKPLVVVSGATGAQGGSVVNSLLAAGKYKIRALTRRPESDKAKALAAKGVEVFKADLAIKEDVKNALNEERQGKMIADVAKEVGLNWLIYRTLGIPKTTFIYVAVYASNFGTFFPIITKDDGTSEFVVPLVKEDTTIEIVDAEADTGPVVAKVIEEGPEKWNGKKVPVASERISFGKIAEVMTKVTGKQFKLRSTNREETKKEFSFLDSEELLDMFRWYNDYGVFGSDKETSDISISKVLHPNITTFEQYAYKKWGNK